MSVAERLKLTLCLVLLACPLGIATIESHPCHMQTMHGVPGAAWFCTHSKLTIGMIHAPLLMFPAG